MSFFVGDVRDDQDRSRPSYAVIVDSVTRQAWTLWRAGGDPAPATPAVELRIQQQKLTAAEDIAAETIAGSGTAALTMTGAPHATFEQARDAANRLLVQAQGGKEIDPAIPPEFVAAIRELSDQVAAARRTMNDALDVLESRAAALEQALYKPLPDPTPSGGPGAAGKARANSGGRSSSAGGSSGTGGAAGAGTSTGSRRRGGSPGEGGFSGKVVRFHNGGFGFARLDNGEEIFVPPPVCEELRRAGVGDGDPILVGRLDPAQVAGQKRIAMDVVPAR